MAKIRVLRLIEYTYDNVERMVEDMQRWTIQGNFPDGPSGGMSFVSTALPPEIFTEPTEETEA